MDTVLDLALAGQIRWPEQDNYLKTDALMPTETEELAIYSPARPAFFPEDSGQNPGEVPCHYAHFPPCKMRGSD